MTEQNQNRKHLDFSRLHEIVNHKFYPHLWNEDRYLYLYGSAGSGKSHFLAQKFIYRLTSEDVGHRLLVIRKTLPSLKRSALKLICDYLSDWDFMKDCDLNKSELTLTYIPNGNQIYFVGMDDPEKIKSIENITSIWYEEASEADYDDALQLDIRLRPKFRPKTKDESGCYSQLCFSFNPISKLNWTYREVFNPDHKTFKEKIRTEIEFLGKKQVVEGYKTVLHSTYKDNRFLSPQYVASLEELASKSESHYKIYALGEYADLKNKIYDNYTPVDVLPVNIEWDVIYSGIDFGYNAPSAMVRTYQKGSVVWEEELLYETKLKTKDIIARLEEMNFPKRELIYADNAEPDRIDELQEAGYNVRPSYKAKNSVKDGIDYIKTLKVYVLRSSTNLLKEYYLYQWKEEVDKNTGQKKLLEEPVKEMDHAMDAKRYGQYTYYKESGRVPKVRFLKIW